MGASKSEEREEAERSGQRRKCGRGNRMGTVASGESLGVRDGRKANYRYSVSLLLGVERKGR